MIATDVGGTGTMGSVPYSIKRCSFIRRRHYRVFFRTAFTLNLGHMDFTVYTPSASVKTGFHWQLIFHI